MFTVFLSVGVGTVAFTTAFFAYRAHRRDQIEQKQLDQFIEQLVYCPDCQDYIISNRQPIAKMKKLQ